MKIDTHELIDSNGVWGCKKCFKIWYYHPTCFCYGHHSSLSEKEKEMKEEAMYRKIKNEICSHC